MTEQENFICGKFLGSGIHRSVYACKLDETKVVKLALGQEGRMFNLLEAKIWAEIRETNFSDWFAPVHSVSDAGLLLIMDRAELGRRQDYPKNVPHFFTDRKYNNYGWIGDKLKCIDYAGTIITNGFTKKIIKADWWE